MGEAFFRGGNSTTVGKVNGTSIDYTRFHEERWISRKRHMEAQWLWFRHRRLQQQAVESAWNEEVNDILQNSELG